MSKTILLAEDTSSIRAFITSILKDAGYKVLAGVDGQDALKYLDGTEIDLVITDLNMPKKDGIELIKDIRSNLDYQYIPIILCTTEGKDLVRIATEAGATAYLPKSSVKDKLLIAVKKMIR